MSTVTTEPREARADYVFSGRTSGNGHVGDLACSIACVIVCEAEVPKDVFATISQTITIIIAIAAIANQRLSSAFNMSGTVVSTSCILAHLTFTL